MESTTLTAPSPEDLPPEEVSADRHRIITILSPKGGAGKTSCATNLSVALARRHPKDVVLVDLDLQFGDVASNLRLSPKTTLADLARKWPVDSAQLKLALASHHTGLYAMCAPLNPAESDEIGADHVSGVLRALHESFSYVVVDTDPGLSERVLSALDLSTDIVLVCSTEVPSIRGLRKAMDALDIVGLTQPERRFLLNRADAKVGLDAADIEKMVGQPIEVRVPSSIDMVFATNDGIPIVESGRNPTIVKAFEMLADGFEQPSSSAASESAKAHGKRLFKRKG